MGVASLINKITDKTTQVKNKYTKMYLKYIYFMMSIQQIHLHRNVLQNTQQLYFYYTNLVYSGSVKLEQLMLCLMHFNCAEVVKSN